MSWYPCCCDVGPDCHTCDEDMRPSSILVTFEGITNTLCSDCFDLNTSFVLDLVEEVDDNEPSPFDRACRWEYSGPSCYDKIVLVGFFSDFSYTFKIHFDSGDNLEAFFNFGATFTPPINCCTFLNGLVLENDTPSPTHQCNLSNATATLTVLDCGGLSFMYVVTPVVSFTPSGVLSGAAAASATIQGPTFTVSGNMTADSVGQMQGMSTVIFSPAGVLIGAIGTSGSTAVTFSTSGRVLGTGALSGTSALTFSTTATGTGSGAMAGSTSLTFTTLLTVSASGMTDLTFTTSGQLTATGRAAGSTALTFAPSASLKGSGAMTGSCNFGFSNTGNLRGTAPLSGNTSLTFAPSASGSSAAPLAGTTTVTFVNAGALRASGAISATFVNINWSPIADLNATGRLTGTTTVTFAPSASLKGAGRATGTSTFTFSNLASLSLSAVKSGITSITFAALGALRGTRLISGSLTVNFDEDEGANQPHLDGIGRLTGTIPVAFTTAGNAKATAPLMGTANVAFATVGLLKGAGLLSATVVSVNWSPIANLKGLVQFVGATTVGFVPTGAMKGTRNVTGTTTITTSTAGQLKGAGRLAGVSSIQFTPSGLLTGEEEECETPCENCGSESTPSTITLRLANGCQCGNCASNTPDTYTVGFEGIINPGDLNCATCDHFFSSYILDRVTVGNESGTCKWEYTGSFCGRTYVLRLEIDSIFVTLQWLDGARVEASWRWEHGGASPNCSGSNIDSNLVFQSANDGDGDCIWAGVNSLEISSSGSCTVVNDGCGSCSSLLGDYVLEQNPDDVTHCQYIGLFGTPCGDMSLSITFSSNGISGGIGLGGVPQAGMQLTQTAPYNCALTVSLGRMSITSTACNFRNVVASIIGTTPCT